MGDLKSNEHLDWLHSELEHGRTSRREFLARAVACGLTASAAASLLAKSTMAATPKRGGHMKLAMGHGSTSDTLDPATIENGFQWTAMFAIANALTEIAPDSSVKPALAESWDVSSDATTWSFKLRKGVTFHDGRPMKSSDVLANLNYHTADDSKSVAKPIMQQIETMKADGDHAITITLKSGNADFAASLSSGNLCIFPAKEDGGIDWESGNGTGGYTLERYEPGVRADFKRDPNFWRSDAAFADSAELLTIADATARNSAIITGEVHAIDQVDLKTAGRMSKVEGVFVEETTGPLHYEATMKCSQAPFDNLHVRRALKASINREEILQKILLGHGVVGNDHPIGPSYPYHAKDLEQTAYDPEKAKWHLKQAELSTLSVDFSASDAAFAGAVDAAVLFQEAAKPAGININVVREPNDGYWSNVWGKKSFLFSYWGGYTTPDEMFTTGYAKGAAWNTYDWYDEKFDQLMVAARAEVNSEKRAEMYGEMQRIARDDGPTIIPVFANAVFARREEIQHAEQVSALRAFDGRQIIERWWMA